MGRPVAIRPSYRDDAAFLLRLEDAVSKDERRPKAWRDETCRMTRELARQLLGAPEKFESASASPRAAKAR